MQQQTKQFPKFWYESNATWGTVESLGDLAEKARTQIAEPNIIDNLDGFLERSRKAKVESAGLPNFGTRREHSSEYTLRQFLADNGLLDEFIDRFNTAQSDIVN